jgi:hypothetical protein
VTLKEMDIEERGISPSIILGVVFSILVFVMALLILVARSRRVRE